MSRRLPEGGRFIDRNDSRQFKFNDDYLQGLGGDTLAAALLANDKMLVGRSFKYHRPRGIVASGVEEPNALLGLGTGSGFEPNQRATTTLLQRDDKLASQNHWPSLEYDVGAVNTFLSRFLPAGFYYKTFIHPRPLWKHVFEPVIRKAAGLGSAPTERDEDSYEHAYLFCDTLVVGGGVAGLKAAMDAAKAGDRVVLLEQTPHWGGRAPVDGGTIEGQEAGDWVNDIVEALETMGNVTLRANCMAAGVYDHGYVIGYEQLTGNGPRHRLWRIRTGHVVTATGAIERPLSFAGNDVPGVMLASAVRDYVVNYAVAPGDRTIVVTNNDDAYRTALILHDAGLEVPMIIDARAEANGPLPQEARARGIKVQTNTGIALVKGGQRVGSVVLCKQDGNGEALREIPCTCVAMSGGWSPVVHLWSHTGGKLLWDAEQAFFHPDPVRPPVGADGAASVSVVGAADGDLRLTGLMETTDEAPLEPVWMMPANAKPAKRAKMFLDYQNDVKVSDVQLAAREGYESVEHTKRYTTLGMATDQGKLSNINGLAILSDALGRPIPQTGTTTFRPPYTPISMGAIAGEARGDIFQPLRRTPIHGRHEEAGAYWEPVGHWRRPYCFPRGQESHRDAVNREINATRTGVGMLDASTLGKILVKGPDAGKFMDLMYTNMMSTLKPGKCRYGLMCSENGFLIDDGVVVRLDEDTFLAHTTTGGADRIHGHMEEWLQTEWWDMQVYTANVTEQWGQIAVVGPKARDVLETLGGMDVSAEALPFMAYADGKLGGFDARVFRISFSGELSYEIAVPAEQALGLWDAIAEAGSPHGITPYGTEALHVMRAEKGFIMIGDESDGTVIPQDLGLHWAISRKKEDFLGKRAQARSHMTDPDRWQLVGLETLDGSVLPDGSYAVSQGRNDKGQGNVQGRVTSTYYSPTLGKGIAMGLVHKGPDRMGQTIQFNTTDGGRIPAKIVSPVFYDPDGEKQNV